MPKSIMLAMRILFKTILEWEWALLLLLLPLILFPTGPTYFILLLIPLLWLIRKVEFGYFFPATPYNTPIFIIAIALGISFFVTFDWTLSLPKIAGYVVGIALFFAAYHSGNEKSVWSITGAFIVIGALIGLIGLIGSNWQAPFDFLNRTSEFIPLLAIRVPGTGNGIINANELAGVLNWITPIMIACSIGLHRRLRNRNIALYALLVFATLLTSFLLLATSSRGGILAFGASTVLVIAFFVPLRWRLVLAIGFAISLLVAVSYTGLTVDQDIVGDSMGLSGRIEIWSRAILAISDHPITGVSVNGFREVVHALYPLFGIAGAIDIAHAHNHIIQVGLDLGIPGMVSYIALWIISAALLLETTRSLLSRHARQHPYYTLVAGLAGSLLAGWIFGIFDAVALGSRPAFLWWILLSLTSAVHRTVVYSGKRLRLYHRELLFMPGKESSVSQANTPSRR